MNSCELVTFISSAACAIAQCTNREEMEILSAALIQLGETLHTILVHNEICCKEGEKKDSHA